MPQPRRAYDERPWRELRTRWRRAIENGARPQCLRCPDLIEPGDAWQLDHVIPLVEGGGRYDAAPSHRRCNAAHGAQVVNQRNAEARAYLAAAATAGQPVLPNAPEPLPFFCY